jgi:hypothetical protein
VAGGNVKAVTAGRDGQVGQDGRVSEEQTGDRQTGVIQETARFLTDYIVLPLYTSTVIAAWVAAAWLSQVWDRFPHLYIFSPEMRCGKTRLLEALNLIVPAPKFTSSISSPALYRSIEAGSASSSGSILKAKDKRRPPTLLLDEAQSLKRVGSESGEVFKELLKAGIEKDSQVYRCGSKSKDFKPEGFRIYCPKVVAMIGEPEGVLADRSLLVEMRRKTKEETVERFRSREVQPRADALRKSLEQWAADYEQAATAIYPYIEPLDIENDRMADLLMPLQTVLLLDGDERRDTLSAYAASLEEREKRPESQSWGIKLLTSCREIFDGEEDTTFIATADLIERLVSRTEEIWHRWNRGQGMTDEALANLLRPYGIRPTHNKTKTKRGYYVSDFQDAFQRYLVSLEKPSSPSIPSSPSGGSKP